MSRLTISSPSQSQVIIEELLKTLEQRVTGSHAEICPVELASAFVSLCQSQTCGKCVPCRIGLEQLQIMIRSVLDGTATLDTITRIENTATNIRSSADCALGYEAADTVLRSVIGFRDEYQAHVINENCACNLVQTIPCVSNCPAGVDIPGYVSLVHEGRYKDAVRLIRKDNPLPVVCAYICENPCESRCRRHMFDESINIRGLKRVAVDQAGVVPAPAKAAATGKKIAIIGGGASGLTAAYYLQLMGHQTTIFEQRNKLGGMLRYGIPSYRLPREKLDQDIATVLSTGVDVQLNAEINNLDKLNENYDAIYISIGAHIDRKLGIDGEDATGVLSAVSMLRDIGNEQLPDFTGKRVAVIGGGNVAMDVARSSVRLGAESVDIAYRRRLEDMTALPMEIEGALEEGCNLLQLHAPIRIEKDEQGNVVALWLQPQRVQEKRGERPYPVNANEPEVRVPCNIVVVAIGQGIESASFQKPGTSGERLLADNHTNMYDNVFAGGDCVTGPATVIRAIAAGKVAAANIDQFLGYNHIIKSDVEIPEPMLSDHPHFARTNMTERPAEERKLDFAMVELGMDCDAAKQEAGRCLRCDHYGFAILKGGRIDQW